MLSQAFSVLLLKWIISLVGLTSLIPETWLWVETLLEYLFFLWNTNLQSQNSPYTAAEAIFVYPKLIQLWATVMMIYPFNNRHESFTLFF